MITLVLIFLGIVFQALDRVHGYTKPEKTFLTHMMLINKVYTDPIIKTSMKEEKTCRAVCQRVDECFAYAYSLFARICNIYKYTPGMQPRPMNSYNLYIVERSEADGYFKFGMSYIKLFLQRMSAYDAQRTCNSILNGMLVSIRNEEENDFVGNIMNDRKVFAAHVGLTDEEEEGRWKFYNGQDVDYTSWNFKGVWNRTDQNCAMFIIGNKWKQISCYDKLPFFCQIPFY